MTAANQISARRLRQLAAGLLVGAGALAAAWSLTMNSGSATTQADLQPSHTVQPSPDGVEIERLHQADQERVQSVLQSLRPELDKNPDFAGVWIDTEAGWVVDIATTGDPASLEATLAPFEDRGVAFRVRKVDYTHAELRALQDQVANDAAAWRELGVTITLIGVDVKANRLKIGVDALTPEAASSLESAYGGQVKLEQQGPAFAF